MVGDYFKSGMDVAKIEAEGYSALNAELAQIAAIQQRGDLIHVIASLHTKGSSPLFQFYVDQDAKNTTRYIAQLSQGGLGLPDRDYYLKSDAKTRKIREQYLQHLTKTFSLLGDSKQQATAHAATVLSLETQLAKASLDNVVIT